MAKGTCLVDLRHHGATSHGGWESAAAVLLAPVTGAAGPVMSHVSQQLTHLPAVSERVRSGRGVLVGGPAP